jgi:hypothetical protein
MSVSWTRVSGAGLRSEPNSDRVISSTDVFLHEFLIQLIALRA